MPRQLVSFEEINNVGVKAKEFWSFPNALAMIYHDVPLYIRRFC